MTPDSAPDEAASPNPEAQGSSPPPGPRRKAALDLDRFTFDMTEQPAPASWTGLFGNDHPVELEVGSGKGLFLVNAATACPDHNFVGIELARKYARRAAERVASRRLFNVKVVPGDAKLFLARYVPPASLRAVHVYFPDPWWKKRHKKRRVFGEALVRDIERGLEPEGHLWVATDVEEYYEVICELMAGHPRFRDLPIPPPKTPEHDLDYLTNFERKYRIEGRPIYRKHYQFDRSGAPEEGSGSPSA